MITTLRKLDKLTLTHRAGGIDRATRKSVILETGTSEIDANVQPYWDNYNSGTVEVKGVEGLCSQDMRTVYTDFPVKTVDQFDFTLADTTIIDGYTFVALWVLPRRHNNGNLRLKHDEVVFGRKDKLEGSQ